jgi:hypothetical protein
MLSKCGACGADVEVLNDSTGGLVQLDTEMVSSDEVSDNMVTKYVRDGDMAINARYAAREAMIEADAAMAEAQRVAATPPPEDAPGPTRTNEGEVVEPVPTPAMPEEAQRYAGIVVPDTSTAYIEHRVLCPDQVTVTTNALYPERLTMIVTERGEAHAAAMEAEQQA